jgi:hypothetical protein
MEVEKTIYLLPRCRVLHYVILSLLTYWVLTIVFEVMMISSFYRQGS